jgi:hypothetical protein
MATKKITISQLRSFIKEAMFDLPGGEKDDEQVPFASQMDKQSALSHERQEGSSLPEKLDLFVKTLPSVATIHGIDPKMLKQIMQQNMEMVKRDLAEPTTDPEDYAHYIVQSLVSHQGQPLSNPNFYT